MSQQYGQPGGGQNPPPQYGQNQGSSQGQSPQYGPTGGQAGGNPAQQPTQYVQGPYGTPPPGYQPNQPQPPYGQPQPPYGQPPGGFTSAPTPVPPMAVLKQPARQVAADGFERSLTLLIYLFSTLAAAGVLTSDTPLSLRSGSGGITYVVSFGLSLSYLIAFALPLAVIYAARTGELVRYHAKQALWLLIAYTVIRLVIELLFLIPAPGVQDILFNGIIVGLLHVILVLAGAFAGVRAFLNREMYALPVIGGFVK